MARFDLTDFEWSVSRTAIEELDARPPISIPTTSLFDAPRRQPRLKRALSKLPFLDR